MITKKIRSRKKNLEQVIFSIFLGALAFGMTGFLVFSNFKIGQKRIQLSGQIDSLKNEVKTLNEKNASLQQGVSKAETDAYWEEKIREQGYQKPGEHPVVVLPSSESQASTTAGAENVWQKLLKKIGF